MPYELHETTNDVLSQDSVLFFAFPASQSLGFGNGTDVNYANTLPRPAAPAQFVADSFRITSGALVVESDAAGNLSGDGTGNFDASTGAYSVTFSQAPLAEIVINCDVSYPAGSTIQVNSAIGGLPYEYTTTQTLNPYDSIMIQDPVQSTLVVGLTSWDNVNGRATGGIWMTRELHDFSKTPNWWKIGQMNNGETPISMEMTKDGDICYIGTTSGRLYRYSNLLAARDDSADILFASSPTVVQDVIRTFSQTITGIAVDPNDNDRVVVTLGNYGNSQYVYYSNNATSASPTFVGKQGNLPTMPVYSVVIDKYNPSSVVVGTEMGTYSLENIDAAGTPQWANENNGMPSVAVFELEQYRTDKLSDSTTLEDGDIYAATHGRGFFRTGSTVQSRPVSIEENELEITREELNVFPNPTSGSTTVKLNLENSNDVRVVVRDLNGRSVITRNLGRMTAGDHEIKLNMGWLTNGIYMVSVEMGNSVSTGKVILQK
ncbi:MAG: T9SS type A sorting domain-containing protein [Flavobacteriia bacterium]|nr:T9SS type A sorting domain-containing protein [Flavobacteriia bacterium]